ncbi:hypothetical protein QUA81_32645 [Microcoleus sp. F6_B4]
MQERGNLGYHTVTIKKPDLTELADENLLRFGLGDRADFEKYVGVSRGVAIALRPRKKSKKDRSSLAVKPPGLAPATAAAFPASPKPGCHLPKALSLITPQNFLPQEFHRLKAHRYSNGI